MRIVMFGLVNLFSFCVLAADGLSYRGVPAVELPKARQSELNVEIRSPTDEIVWTGGDLAVDVEGFASAIGGVKYLDIMLVLDASKSLEKTDPDDFRSLGAIGLVRGLSAKSDAHIGVVSFNDYSALLQPLTPNRDDVVAALENMDRSAGTNIAAGVLTAVAELEQSGRPGSSRLIMLFTDGKSNRRAALEAAETAQSKGITVQALALGKSRKGNNTLEEIAALTGGTFIQVSDPEKLPEAFLNLRTTGVDNVKLSVNGSPPIDTALSGGAFSGRVPVEIGRNRIVAVATGLDEQVRESTVHVNVRDASCAALEVAALDGGRPTLSLNERSIELVIDASRSMWGQINGESKMSIAQRTLRDAADWLPRDISLALRAYGNNSSSKANDCADSTLLVPFDAANRGSIRQAIEGLRPRGQTPIAHALLQAASDFSARDGERSLVMVTDGIESCGGDPVSAARELRERGVVVHVIGFGLGNGVDEDSESLQAIARASGGHFLTAATADELRRALERTVGTPFTVVDAAGGGGVVARSALGRDERLMLPPGAYRVALESLPPHEVAVQLAPSEAVMLTLENERGVVSHAEQRDPLAPRACEVAMVDRAEEEAAAQPLSMFDDAPARERVGHAPRDGFRLEAEHPRMQ